MFQELFQQQFHWILKVNLRPLDCRLAKLTCTFVTVLTTWVCRVKRFLLLSNGNPFAAVGPFGSTPLKWISLRSVVHSVTWLMSSLCYIILLIMYKFFFSNVVQASLVSLVGWSSDRKPSSLHRSKKFQWAIISLNYVLIVKVFHLRNINFTSFWSCFFFYIAVISF